ncbi:MAG: Nif3-like dinuclear metal center hexameric protein [Bacteroidetes bacterium]|nr:Nif3-like dinuclear metal center hexameric protein [Bacteroidota bacterium]
MRIREIVNAISEKLPIDIVSGQDNVGLIIGNYDDDCDKMTVAYELNTDVLNEALRAGANLIVTYHTPLFKPAKSFTSSRRYPDPLLEASRSRMNILAVHTALDVVKTGLNFDLARKIGLNNIQFLSPLPDTLVKVVVYVPASHAEEVRLAMSQAGGGRIGDYYDCSFSLEGNGTFLPGKDATPYIGTANKKETVEETRLEMLVEKPLVGNVIRKMLEGHPYEEVAYDIYPLANDSPNFGFGAIGELDGPTPIRDFLESIKRLLEVETLRVSHLPDVKTQRVSVCAGAGVPFYKDAVRKQADVYLTGDVKHHDFREARSSSAVLVDATHSGTEKFATGLIYEILGETFKDKAVIGLSKHQEQNALIV